MPLSIGILMLTATMAAGEPNVTPHQLQANCEKLAAQHGGRRPTRLPSALQYPFEEVLVCGDPHIFDPRGHQHMGLLVRSHKKPNLWRVPQVHQHWPLLLQP
jgi:hypothetical protein